jgi:hypothetical protein
LAVGEITVEKARYQNQLKRHDHLRSLSESAALSPVWKPSRLDPMSKTGQNSVKAEARNHTFDFISPADTIKTGDPNSCNTCHTDKTAQWALDYVDKWYPKSP